MKCPSCGRESREGSRFCPGCGNDLTSEEAKPVQEDTTPEVAAGEEEAEAEEPTEGLPPEPEVVRPDAEGAKPARDRKKTSPPKKKTRKWPIAVAILVIIALIGTGVGVYFIWIREGEEKGSEEEFKYETREYEVQVEIPEGTPLDLSQTQLTYGIEGETDLENIEGNKAGAKVLMNDPATGLITLQDRNTGDELLYVIFPKDSESLRDYTPAIDIESTAASLVFVQFGIVSSNPVQARLMLEAIKELPETQELARYIGERMLTDPAVLSHEDQGIADRSARAYLAFMNLALEKANNNVNPVLGGASAGSMYCSLIDGKTRTRPSMSSVGITDVDGVDEDGISVELSFNPDTMKCKIDYRNYQMWPAFFFLEKKEDYPSFEKSTLVEVVPERIFELPNISELVTDVIWGMGEYAWDKMFNQSKGSILDYLKKKVWEEHQEEYAEVLGEEFPVDSLGDYYLVSYFPGWKDSEKFGEALQSGDIRVFFPWFYKVVSEAIEVVNIYCDVFDLGFMKTSRFKKSIYLFMKFVSKFAAKGKECIDCALRGDLRGSLEVMIELAVTLVKDPDFIEWLTREAWGPGTDLPREVADKAIDFFGKISKKLPALLKNFLAVVKAIDIGIEIGNTFFRLYSWLSEAGSRGPVDIYQFTLTGQGGTSPTATTGSDTVFVMDVSGSMGDAMEGDNKLYHARMAAGDLVRTIKNESMTGGVTHAVGLVTYTDSATINSQLSSNYSSVESVISGLTPQSSTNMEDGINKGIAVLRNARPGTQKIMVLLSDGLPNVGASSLEDLLAGCVDAAKREGIVISTVGFGDDCDENLLSGIASYTGGTYNYANNYFALSSVYIKIRHEAMGSVIYTDEDTITASGGTRRKTFDVGGGVGEINGTVNWKGAAVLDFKLFDPRGRQVDASYPGASLFKDRNPMQFIVKNPLEGTWVLEIVLAQPSGVVPGRVLAGARLANNGIYAAMVYAQEEEEGGDDDQGDTDFQVVVSTRGEKEDLSTYPLILWIVLGASMLLALALFFLFNRRISPPLRRE